MGWHGPQQCDETCCSRDVPSPCDKPVVTCRRTVDPQKFTYTVTDADEARIEERCTNPYGGVTYTSHEIELDESGNASGEYYTLANCEYCVVATNECGTVLCCDGCRKPTCRIVSVTLQSDGSIRVSWEYGSGSSPFDTGGGDPVVSATLNGIDILGDPHFASGETYFAKADIPDVLTIALANDCGQSSTCIYNIPCCWNKTELRITITGADDVFRTCSETYDPVYNGTEQLMAFEAEISLSGLSALNGSYLFETPNSDCASADEFFVGTFDAYWYWKQTVRGPRIFGGIGTEVQSFKLEISGIKLYVRKGGIFIKLPATGTVTVTGDDVAFNSPLDPVFTPTVTFNPSRYWSFGAFNLAICPGGYSTGEHPVTGVISGPSSFVGWITGITGPGAAFVNPVIEGPCPSTAPETFSVEAEYLV